jgi:hypothetical protein
MPILIALLLTLSSTATYAQDADDAYSDEPTAAEGDPSAKKPRKREKVERGWSVGLGPVLLSNLNVDGVGFNVHGGMFWDLHVAAIHILTDLNIRNDAILASLGIGGKWFMIDAFVTPYLGADFGVAVSRMGNTAFLSDSYNGGFAVAGSTGVHLFRTSSVNLEIGVRVQLLLNSTTQGFPFASSARITLHWL